VVRLYIKEKWREHRHGFLASDVSLREGIKAAAGSQQDAEMYHFCLKDQEGMELFEFWGSTQGFLGHIELPSEAIGIPRRREVDVKKWLQARVGAYHGRATGGGTG
jgi:hypothetical protein